MGRPEVYSEINGRNRSGRGGSTFGDREVLRMGGGGEARREGREGEGVRGAV